MAEQSSTTPANMLIDMIAGHRATAVLYVAARLDIADHLSKRPVTSAELARLTGTHEPSLRRLMRALVALGICRSGSEAKFELTEMGTLLSAGAERSLRAWALVEGGMIRATWTELLESIRTGKTVGELAGAGSDRFEALARSNQAELFNEGMVSMTRNALPGLLANYDFTGITALMDVGGGLGQLLSAILKRYPAMRGIVFDLPHCEEAARKHLAAEGVADRCEFVAGNFFTAVPSGADAIIMKNIIHDWNDERCVQLLHNCHGALKPGARLMLVERVMPERLEPSADHLNIVLMDLNMLRGPGGLERTEEEFRRLLVKGGFRMTRSVPAGRYNVIEAIAA